MTVAELITILDNTPPNALVCVIAGGQYTEHIRARMEVNRSWGQGTGWQENSNFILEAWKDG